MLAKGKIYVSKEKMSELLSLPEGVELIAVKVKESDEGYEFLVVSAEETVCTKKNVPVGLMRRTSVDTLEHFKNKPTGGIVATGQLAILPRGETILSKKDMEELFKALDNLPLQIHPNTSEITINVVSNKEPEKQDVQKLFESISKAVREKGSK